MKTKFGLPEGSEPPSREQVYKAVEQLIDAREAAKRGLEPGQRPPAGAGDRIAAMLMAATSLASQAGLDLEAVARDIQESRERARGQKGQPPQGQAPAPFTGKLTKTQAGILRTLWELETGQGQLSSLRHGLHSSAAKLVERGLIWKKDRWPARPVYGITPAGIPAALEAWRELCPQKVEEVRRAMNLPP